MGIENNQGYLGQTTPQVNVTGPQQRDSTNDEIVSAMLDIGADQAQQNQSHYERLSQQVSGVEAQTADVSNQIKRKNASDALSKITNIGSTEGRGGRAGRNFSGGKLDLNTVGTMVADFYTMGGASAAKSAAQSQEGQQQGAGLTQMSTNTASAQQMQGAAGKTQGATTASGAQFNPNASTDAASKASSGGGGWMSWAGTALGLLNKSKSGASAPQSPLLLGE